MNKLLLQLMDLQGEIKIRLMKSGISQEKSHEIAGDILDYIVRSPIAASDYHKAYEDFLAEKNDL